MHAIHVSICSYNHVLSGHDVCTIGYHYRTTKAALFSFEVAAPIHVRPALSLTATLAPASISVAIDRGPLCSAARCNGVIPSCEATRGDETIAAGLLVR